MPLELKEEKEGREEDEKDRQERKSFAISPSLTTRRTDELERFTEMFVLTLKENHLAEVDQDDWQPTANACGQDSVDGTPNLEHAGS